MDVEEFVNENLRPEMVAIIIAIIKFVKIYSCKVDENEKASKDITKSDIFNWDIPTIMDYLR